MNKGELIDAVAAATDDTKAGAGRAVDAVIESITGALKKGDSVTLIGFGTFKLFLLNSVIILNSRCILWADSSFFPNGGLLNT